MSVSFREVQAAATALMLHMFAPHELPLDDELKAKYVKAAEAALQAAARVRSENSQRRSRK
jgi:hypothetical protein